MTCRCFLGDNPGPAQWPDCNRYVEAIIAKLCRKHPAAVRSNGSITQRWSLVINDYKMIRDKITSNAKVMAETKLQLVDINQTTVIQWYNKNEKQKELQPVIEQGIRLPKPDMTGQNNPFRQLTPALHLFQQLHFLHLLYMRCQITLLEKQKCVETLLHRQDGYQCHYNLQGYHSSISCLYHACTTRES